jgi:hypothetical protein
VKIRPKDFFHIWKKLKLKYFLDENVTSKFLSTKTKTQILYPQRLNLNFSVDKGFFSLIFKKSLTQFLSRRKLQLNKYHDKALNYLETKDAKHFSSLNSYKVKTIYLKTKFLYNSIKEFLFFKYLKLKWIQCFHFYINLGETKI